MGVRGRTSAEALSVIGPSGIETYRRPDAPDELTSEQAAEWHAVVNRMPADWFPRETHAMLVQYCRLLIRARRLAQLIDAAENAERFDVDAYRDLVRSEKLCRVLLHRWQPRCDQPAGDNTPGTSPQAFAG